MVNFFYLDKDPNKCAQYYCNKHVLKIPIEIAQILSKIHHGIRRIFEARDTAGLSSAQVLLKLGELETGIDYCKIYKNSVVVKNTLGPYCWVKESYDNYIWTSKLGLALINEYKLRYNKDSHKSEVILQYLADNPPKLPKIGITKFRGTNKYDMFQYISKDPIICARYNYAEMKCLNDKWDIHGPQGLPTEVGLPPNWYIETRKYILEEKKKLVDKINEQVRSKLPALVTKGDKVYRFHSFLRVTYDHLFQGKWDVKANMMNKYNKNEPLLYQLTFPQLYFVYEISKSLENKEILNKLNVESLRYRKKLKFPIKNINYRENPEYYIYTKKSFLEVDPYNKEINEIIDNNLKMHNLLLKYIKNKDFIGMDMICKYCKNNKFNNILELIENNEAYKNWINSFNWKITNPYQPAEFIL